MNNTELPLHIKANYLLKIKTSLIMKYTSRTEKVTKVFSFVTFGENDIYSGFILRDIHASIICFVSSSLMAEWYITNDNLIEAILDKNNRYFYISPEVFSKNDKLYGVHIIREIKKQNNIIVRLPPK